MEEYSDELESKYNEAFLQIARLNEAWSKCNYYSVLGNFKKWNWIMDVIWRELSVDATRIGGEDINENKYYKKIDELNKQLNQKLKDGLRRYNILTEKEMTLRQLQDDAGKGAKYKSKMEGMFEE